MHIITFGIKNIRSVTKLPPSRVYSRSVGMPYYRYMHINKILCHIGLNVGTIDSAYPKMK